MFHTPAHKQHKDRTLSDYIARVTHEQPSRPGVPDYMDKQHDWVGFDFDRTLATYTSWAGPAELGEPIAPIVALLRATAKEHAVKIFTARIWPVIEHIPGVGTTWDPRHTSIAKERCMGAIRAVHSIQSWCEKHLDMTPNITCIKDIHCIRLYDDIAVQVVPNMGELV